MILKEHESNNSPQDEKSLNSLSEKSTAKVIFDVSALKFNKSSWYKSYIHTVYVHLINSLSIPTFPLESGVVMEPILAYWLIIAYSTY